MACESVHIQVANRNQRSINHLCKHREEHSPWIVTVAFYKALHIVEAVFANDSSIGHTSDHPTRFLKLRTTRKYEHIYRHYSKLSRASNVARYLEDGTNGTDVSCFDEYLSPDKVTTKFLFDHLKQIENSARGRLENPDDLLTVDDARQFIKQS